MPLSQAVDDKNVPGMDRVDSLADYLVQLRDKTGLTNQQVCHFYRNNGIKEKISVTLYNKSHLLT